jgi:hypothetical protein
MLYVEKIVILIIINTGGNRREIMVLNLEYFGFMLFEYI